MVLKVLWIKILFIKLTNSSKHSLMLAKIGIEVHLMQSFCLQNRFLLSSNEHVAKTGIEANMPNPLELFLVFLQQTCLIHYFRSKTLVLDGSAPFHCRTRPATKISIWVHLKHEFVPRKPFRVWSQRTCSIHNFRSKTHVYNSA